MFAPFSMMTDASAWLDVSAQLFQGIAIEQWLFVTLAFFVILIVLRLSVIIVVRTLSRVRHGMKAEIARLIATFLAWIPVGIWLFFAFVSALQLIELPPVINRIVCMSVFSLIVILGIVLAHQVTAFIFLQAIRRSRQDDTIALPTIFNVTIGFVLWSLGVLLVLSNLGVNVLSLVAGLGIGGIAVALAAQNILGDIFSSYSLTFDQPFKEGDFIVVGPHMGIVKKIGVKTTRLQALQGEEIIIPNQELTSTRIQNFKRMRERRIVFTFGVTYDTPPEKLRDIPNMIRTIMEGIEHTRFDRAHFCRFGDSRLEIEVVYFVNRSEYELYMNAQQAINLAIMEQCASRGIAFAFPTRTVHVVGDER